MLYIYTLFMLFSFDKKFADFFYCQMIYFCLVTSMLDMILPLTPKTYFFQYFDFFSQISLAVSDMVLSFLSALVLYLCIEAPLRNIFKELLMPSRSAPVVKSPKEIIEEESVMENNIVRNMVHYEKETTSRL